MVDEQATGELHAAAAALRQPPVTGDGAVDDAIAGLADLDSAPLEDHPAVYEGVHRTLADLLTDVEG